MPNFEEAAQFMKDWWSGAEMPRPVLNISIPVQPDPKELMPLPEIKGTFCPPYTMKNMDYRLARENNIIVSRRYFAEGMAVASPMLGAGSLAFHLGGTVIENHDTVWVEHGYKSIKEINIFFDENNASWKYQWELINKLIELGKDRFIVRHTDMLEGLDILSALLGPQQLVFDLMDYPEIVMEKAKAINEIFLSLYFRILNIIRDKLGGSHYLFWSPGIMYRGQCDFAALLSPQMFKTYALPDIKKIMDRMDNIIYHWDGPGALCHLDALLETIKLDVLQWVPGAGNPSGSDKKWWPMYHRILEAGKRIQLAGAFTLDDILPVKKEFGKKFYKFMINMTGLETEEQALNAIRLLSDN